MIARLTGTLVEKTPASAIVQTGGVGFEVLISNRTYEKLPEKGLETSLHTYTHVREDEIRLVGFLDQGEKEFFIKLLGVSGISIKIALSSLSIYSADELKRIIIKKETDLIRRIPGIGKKLAERTIVELKDKLEENDLEITYGGVFMDSEKMGEVRQALKTLGYTSQEIAGVLKKINIDILLDKKTEDILKIALKEM